MKTPKQNITLMENEIDMLVSAFLLVPTLNTARTKIDLIKSYFSLPGTKTRSGEMGRGGERRKWGVSGHGQPASLCHSLGRNSRQWGRAMLQYIYTSPFPLIQASSSWRSLGINTDIGKGGRAAFLPALPASCHQGGLCFSFFNYTNLSALLWLGADC